MLYSYQLAPRAKIFRRDQGKVSGLALLHRHSINVRGHVMETCCSDGFSCVPLVYPFCKKGFFYVDFALATCCIKFSWFELACLVVGMTGKFQCRIVCTALASCSRNNANITNIRFVCTHQFAYSPCNRRTNERTCDSFTSLDMSNSVYQSLQCTCQALFEPA